MAVNKLIPDDLKLEGITEEGANHIAGSPKAICDYINHLVEAYNDRVDDINEYYMLYHEKCDEVIRLKEDCRKCNW